MKVTVDQFFEHLLKELETHPELKGYYRFLNDEKSFEFRKAYYVQRLQYIADQMGDVHGKVWDIGCGYGTTAIFLALNGYQVHGSTLEYYFKEIPKRLDYWSMTASLLRKILSDGYGQGIRSWMQLSKVLTKLAWRF